MDELSEQAPGLEFPCRYPVKAMGRQDQALIDSIWGIVTAHAPETPADALQTTASRQGRFISVTITITAHSRAQLDAIYADLRASDQVLAAL